MKCKNCLAANGEKVCLAGVRPYTLRTGEQGCCYNVAQVHKGMRNAPVRTEIAHDIPSKFAPKSAS